MERCGWVRSSKSVKTGSYVEQGFEADPEFAFQQLAVGGVACHLSQRRGGKIGALVVGLQFEDGEVDGQPDGGRVYAEEEDGGGLQLLSQGSDGYRCGMVIDDGHVADIKAAGFGDLCEEVELRVGEEWRVGGVDEDGGMAPMVAEEFVDGRFRR